MPFTTTHAAIQRYLTLNFASTVAPTHLTVHGKDYLTAPAVLIVEGVLNQAWIRAEELIPSMWQGIPVVCNHPYGADGTPVSARDPEVLARCGMGYLSHPRLGSGFRQRQAVTTLQAEIWLDTAQVQTLGGEALEAMRRIESREMLEVSTGFFAEGILQNGTAYGDPFTEILTNLIPDHLALLPHGVGACAIEHGCGIPRLNRLVCNCQGSACTCPVLGIEETSMAVDPSAQEAPRGWRGFLQVFRQWIDREEAATSSVPVPMMTGTAGTTLPHSEGSASPVEIIPGQTNFLVTEMTDQDARETLYGALAREMGTDWTPIFIDSIDMGNQAFVYRQGERLLMRRWTVDALGILQLDPNTEDVQRDSRFVPIPGTSGPASDPEDDSNRDIPGMMEAFATTPRCAICQHFLATTATGQRCVHCQGDPARIPQVQAATNRCPDCGGLVDMTPDVTGATPTECPSCGTPFNPPTLTMQQERTLMTAPLVVSPIAIKARVNNLILNKQYGWGERDRSMLEAMPEATLIRLESQPIIVPPVEPPAPEPDAQTPEDAINRLSPHLQDMFRAMYRDHQERRQAALAILIAHKSCPFEQDELQAMSVDRLEKLVAMGAGVEYSGRGLPAVRTPPEVLEAPPMPINVEEAVVARQRSQGLRN